MARFDSAIYGGNISADSIGTKHCTKEEKKGDSFMKAEGHLNFKRGLPKITNMALFKSVSTKWFIM